MTGRQCYPLRLRETAVEFGEQRIDASHHSIMFARRQGIKAAITPR